MKTRIELLTPETIASMCRFSEKAWDRPRTEAYYQWRYQDAPNLVTVVAQKDGECLATVSAFSRKYRLGDEVLECFEAFDWFCQPEFRAYGLGLQVMKHLMDLKRPIIVLGGSEDTRRILPGLGWQKVAEGRRYVLPLAGEFVRERLSTRSAFIRFAAGMAFRLLTPLRNYRRSLSRDSRRYPIPGRGMSPRLESLSVDSVHSIAALPNADQMRWLIQGFPGLGMYLPFGFIVNGHLAAWALGRIFLEGDRSFGSIVDIQPAQLSSKDLAWVVRTVVAALAGFGLDAVRTTATSPVVQKALVRNGFFTREPVRAMIWPGGRTLPAGPVHLMCNVCDDAFDPLPTSDEHRLLYPEH